MSYKKIIPCLDINKGRVVKGVNFEGLRDAGDPVEVAQGYVDAGADEIVFLDISSTVENRQITLDLVKKVAAVVTVPFTVGGGIRTLEDAQSVLNAGATTVSIGSAAVQNPHVITEISNRFGKESITIAIDARKSEADGSFHVMIRGGQTDTGIDVVDWAKEVEALGAGSILLTSMDRDGVCNGYDMELTKAVTAAVSIPVTASGGAGKLSDFYDILTEGGATGALAASLFHFKTVEVRQVKEYLLERGVSVTLSPEKKTAREQNSAFSFEADELIPVIAQDATSKEVLMLAYMNAEAYRKTVMTGKAHYYSRSRQKIWLKGEESGHFQSVQEIRYDCDHDTLLLLVEQIGGACHTGHKSCFYRSVEGMQTSEHVFDEKVAYKKDILTRLQELVSERKSKPVEGSYTNYLFEKGIDKILKKVGEESAEVIIASKNEGNEELVCEVSDLIYHLTVLLVEKKTNWDAIRKELTKRWEE